MTLMIQPIGPQVHAAQRHLKGNSRLKSHAVRFKSDKVSVDVASLTDKDIEQLAEETIQGFQERQLKQFTPQQLYLLSGEQFKAFSPQQLAMFTAGQIAKLTGRHLQYLSDDQVLALRQKLNRYQKIMLTEDKRRLVKQTPDIGMDRLPAVVDDNAIALKDGTLDFEDFVRVMPEFQQCYKEYERFYRPAQDALEALRPIYESAQAWKTLIPGSPPEVYLKPVWLGRRTDLSPRERVEYALYKRFQKTHDETPRAPRPGYAPEIVDAALQVWDQGDSGQKELLERMLGRPDYKDEEYRRFNLLLYQLGDTGKLPGDVEQARIVGRFLSPTLEEADYRFREIKLAKYQPPTLKEAFAFLAQSTPYFPLHQALGEIYARNLKPSGEEGIKLIANALEAVKQAAKRRAWPDMPKPGATHAKRPLYEEMLEPSVPESPSYHPAWQEYANLIASALRDVREIGKARQHNESRTHALIEGRGHQPGSSVSDTDGALFKRLVRLSFFPEHHLAGALEDLVLTRGRTVRKNGGLSEKQQEVVDHFLYLRKHRPHPISWDLDKAGRLNPGFYGMVHYLYRTVSEDAAREQKINPTRDNSSHRSAWGEAQLRNAQIPYAEQLAKSKEALMQLLCFEETSADDGGKEVSKPDSDDDDD